MTVKVRDYPGGRCEVDIRFSRNLVRGVDVDTKGPSSRRVPIRAPVPSANGIAGDREHRLVAGKPRRVLGCRRFDVALSLKSRPS
jgi:hypothetical protein